MKTSTANRAGFTLAELLVALVLLGVVGTAIITTVVRQQRFYTDTAEVIETRTNVRQIADLLSTDLRSVSPRSGDLRELGIGGVTFRNVRGSSVICNLLATNDQIVLPPVNLSRRNQLTAWSTPPEVGDSVMIYDVEASPRVWHRREIIGVGPGVCLSILNFGANVAEDAGGTLLTLSGPALPASMINGAPVRIYRVGRYELYQSASRDWYLGYRDCMPNRAPVCQAWQPVSGPYLPLGTASFGGLSMRYFDANGVETTDSSRIARINVVVRAASKRPVRMLGDGGAYRDSISFSIAVRN